MLDALGKCGELVPTLPVQTAALMRSIEVCFAEGDFKQVVAVLCCTDDSDVLTLSIIVPGHRSDVQIKLLLQLLDKASFVDYMKT